MYISNVLRLSEQFLKFAQISVRRSKIHGFGTFAQQDFGTGQEIGLALELTNKNNPGIFTRTDFAKKVNHKNTANMYLKKIGNNFYFIAKFYISNGTELTTNYIDYENILKREHKELQIPLKII